MFKSRHGHRANPTGDGEAARAQEAALVVVVQQWIAQIYADQP